MNIDLYKHIQANGLNMTSPAVGIGNNALSAVNQADNALQPLENLGLVDVNILQSARQTLNMANSSVTGTVSHIAQTANDSLRLSSMASQVNKLDALVNVVPSSCFNSEALFASVNGACDELLNSIADTSAQITNKVSDYLNGLIDTSALEAFLAGIGNSLQSFLDDLSAKLLAELELLNELKDKIQASSLAQSILALWNNPCTQAVLDTTLPPDIKALL